MARPCRGPRTSPLIAENIRYILPRAEPSLGHRLAVSGSLATMVLGMFCWLIDLLHVDVAFLYYLPRVLIAMTTFVCLLGFVLCRRRPRK